MDENVFEINGGITINVDVSVKNIIHVKNIIFGILLRVVVKMVNVQQVLLTIQGLYLMKLLKKKQKQLQKILMKKMQSVKRKISVFYLSFY